MSNIKFPRCRTAQNFQKHLKIASFAVIIKRASFFERNIRMDKLIKKFVSLLPKALQDIYYKYEDKWLYLFFGVLTTVVSFITAGIAKFVLEKAGAGNDLVTTVSSAFSWVCSVTFAYLTNRAWVFNSTAKGAKEIRDEAVSFYGGRVFTLLVEMFIMWAGGKIFDINAKLFGIKYFWIIKIAANVIVLILNYVISKLFVFRKKKEDANV